MFQLKYNSNNNVTQFYYKFGNIGKQFNFGRYTSNNNLHL